MTDESLSGITLKERFAEYLASPKDNLRSRLIEAVSHHEGWEESAIAMVDDAIIPAINEHKADCQRKLDEIFSMGDASTRKDEDSEEKRFTPLSKGVETSPASSDPREMRYVDEEKLGQIAVELIDTVATHISDGRTPLRTAFCKALRPYISAPMPVMIDLDAAARALWQGSVPWNNCTEQHKNHWRDMAKACAEAWGFRWE